jgi:hypothetical protein
MNTIVKGKTMNCKSKTFALAFGLISVVLSLGPASAATVVRDHREKPIVRDHRAEQPVVRDHRRPSNSGGVSVTNSTSPRKRVNCLGSLC